MSEIIRLATPSDSQDILNICAPYVRDTAISFETEVPSVNEFACRIENIVKQYPYLVYQINNEIVGYAYASKHRERAAYGYDVDVSIYIRPSYHGSGVVHKLNECLFKILKEQGYINVYAEYSVPNEKSIKFHRKFGFTSIGTFHNTGYKFGKWHDVVWIEKTINTNLENPQIIKSIVELPFEFLSSVLIKNTAI